MNEKGAEVNTLYFGFDESNHAGPDKKGEIISTVFSIGHEDSVVRRWPNVRRNPDLEKWLAESGHDYRFTILTGEEYRYQSSAKNLTEAAPNLVTSILTEPYSPFSQKDIKMHIDCIKLYFDGGGFRKDQKDTLRDYFRSLGLKDVVVDNFIKKSKNSRGKTCKGPRCPKLVYLSDVLSNVLFHLSAGELLFHPKFVPHYNVVTK
ncbi:MAG TPA: hypothetical protein VJ438_04890 [Candidatus Nanoarchaeia archaeon]|nr:hypothetical protein [Candidatus Nanoarchaeia archaeon]